MILMLGDIHGNWNKLINTIKSKKISDCAIIQVGDFGVGYRTEYNELIHLKNLDKELHDKNIIMYCIRGNHDDKNYFNGGYIFDNLKLMSDYSVLKIEEYNFLFVGGAVSIDRKYNLSKMQLAASLGLNSPSYWYDEVFNLDKDKLANIKDIDIVVTHTCPQWCPPDNTKGFGSLVMSFAKKDSELLSDLKCERDMLTEMFNILISNGNKIKKHYYGHFHRSQVSYYGDTQHILLDIDEFQLIDKYYKDNYIENAYVGSQLF